MNETNYRIKYSEGNFEVEVQGDKEWVEKKFAELMDKKPSGVTKETKEEEESTTLVEFIEIKGNPKKNTDIATVFAYWLLKRENIRVFNVRDIENLYNRTRTSKPKNLSDTIYKTTKKHFFAEAKEEKDGIKAYSITRKGERYVESLK